MNVIGITHNPFTVKTDFLFGGSEIPRECSLYRFRDLRLQRWVDKLFPELVEIFNGRKQFDITFVGIESDYLDLEEAANLARRQGASIQLAWIKSKPAEARWLDMERLFDEVQSYPRYRAMVDTDATLQELLEEATNRDFDVHVVATMSSGKSTLVNAMLGRDLLPTSNEATTATITRIYDNDAGQPGIFTGERIGPDGELLDQCDAMDLAIMSEWNKTEGTHQIRLNGRILGVRERAELRLVLSDTPGPNNGNDDGTHRRTTLSYVQDTRRCPMILYVLNATQPGINDDKNLLSLVAKTMREGGRQNSDRFIFVLNKMDCLDEERGDDVARIQARTKAYLEKLGIAEPQIFPASAKYARLCRHRDGDLSRKDRLERSAMDELFREDEIDFVASQKLPRRAHAALAERKLSALEVATGVPSVEAMIDAYAEKYHLPHRLERCRAVLNRVVSRVVDEAQLTAELDKGEGELKAMRQEIARLKKRSDIGLDMQVYEERIRREGIDLPEEVHNELTVRRMGIRALRNKLGENFTGHVEPRKAAIAIEEARETLQFHFDELINAYEAAFALSQDLIKRDLETRYRDYVDSIFENMDAVQFPVLARLKDRISDLSFSLDLSESHIKGRKERTGTRRVSTSKWWNPFSWGDGYDVAIMTEVKYVDLEEYFKEKIVKQMSEFSKLERDAIAIIEQGREALVSGFLSFVRQEFSPRLNELVATLYKRIDEEKLREAAIVDARKMLDWGRDIQRRIDELFHVGERSIVEVA